MLVQDRLRCDVGALLKAYVLALLAPAADPTGLTDAAPFALFAHAASPTVLTDAAPSALLADLHVRRALALFRFDLDSTHSSVPSLFSKRKTLQPPKFYQTW